MSQKKVIRLCPVCNNNYAEILHHQDFTLPKGNPLPHAYDIISCLKCGFVFADTSAKQSVYNAYYTSLSKYEDTKVATGTGINQNDYIRLKKTAADIKKVIKNKNTSILDIGCANGGLLTELYELGFRNLYGSDPSAECMKHIKKNGFLAEKRGLFSKIKQDKKTKYHFIVLTHVMEHIRDLQGAIKNLSFLLEKDGRIYIEVPDASRYDRFYITPYYYIDSEHINHFDKNSLINIFGLNGYEPIKIIKKEVNVAGGYFCPVFGIFFQKASNIEGFRIVKSKGVKQSLKKSLDASKKDKSLNVIDQLAFEHQKIIVWGVGSFTQRLLASTNLRNCNIVMFIDNDSKKHGLVINGKKIMPAQSLLKSKEPVLICSAVKSSEIEKQIKKIDPNRKIILLSGKI